MLNFTDRRQPLAAQIDKILESDTGEILRQSCGESFNGVRAERNFNGVCAARNFSDIDSRFAAYKICKFYLPSVRRLRR